MAVNNTVSLKDYFEARINNLEKTIASQEIERANALSVATKELERRLEDLNHAHRRASDVLNTYLPRELWEKFREDDAEWKRATEIFRASTVTQSEFRLYKETTQQALILSSGKEQGISNTWSGIVVGFSILATIGTIVTAFGVFFHNH